jgi:hypothetical protein
MKNYFPARSRSAVLYPLGDSKKKELEALPHYQNKEFTIVYAGNCYGAYGRMLLKLAKAIKVTPGIHLKIFPVGKGWSEEDIKEMTEAGIYKSFLPFPELQLEFAKADAFLTVMSFEEPEKPFVSTSFTTKWLDYAAYGKPVITWSPEYSSSNVFASQHQSAVIIDVDDPMKVIEKILLLSKEEIAFYSCKSKKISAELFNPDTIHEVFLKGIYHAISTN